MYICTACCTMLDLTVHSVFGNSFAFEEIYTWIQRMTNHSMPSMCFDACLAVTGAPGIGKTYGIETVCRILGVKINKIDSSNCYSTKDLADLLTKMATASLEEQLLQHNTKRIVFIDEFEIMIGVDRNMPSALSQLLCGEGSKAARKLSYVPVVIACNSNIEKKLGDIKRLCKIVHLRPPSDADIILMLREHTRSKHVHIPADKLVSVAERAAGNMMQAIEILKYELLSSRCSAITNCDGGDNRIDKMPDIDILYENPSRDMAAMLFEEDMWMNPLRFHENLSAELERRKGTRAQKGAVYSGVLMCMLEWDVMACHASTEGGVGGSGGYNIATEHLCKAPCHILPRLEGKKNAKEASMSGFTKTLSQMSLQSKMEKQAYSDGFPWKHVGSYSYMLKKRKKH